MRSLKPIDNIVSKLRCCRKCTGDAEQVPVEEEHFDDIEAGQEIHLSIIKLKTRDSNANAVNELKALVVNGHGPPKIMQNVDMIGVEVEQDPATEMRKNGKIFMSNGNGIYGKPKG